MSFSEFGNIDIYLFDQLQRGILEPGMHVLDAGCGKGRNIEYLVNHGYRVAAIDQDEKALETVRSKYESAADCIVKTASLDAVPFEDGDFHYVICNAVLHFARDEVHFNAMLSELARVLKPGGIFFSRLMSTYGSEAWIESLGGGRYRLPDKRELYLTETKVLQQATENIFKGSLLDPLKSTVVHGQRTMTTWIVRRG